ncbi:MAG TPA: hypothetical protein VNZ86_04385 [Bacteroidia bacterium]|nr:hypothetical protein [Bacteroidia bacterium]
MKRFVLSSGILLILATSISSCKKCSTCTATATNGKVIAQQQYCSSSSTNITTFENSFKTTYGISSVCKRQ